MDFILSTHTEKGKLNRREKKGSKGKLRIPWSLHMRSFWKIHFINPPEEQGKLLLIQKDGLRWLKFIQKSDPCQGPSFAPFFFPANAIDHAMFHTQKFGRIIAQIKILSTLFGLSGWPQR